MQLNHSMDLDIDNVTKLISEFKNTDVPKIFPLMATGSSLQRVRQFLSK